MTTTEQIALTALLLTAAAAISLPGLFALGYGALRRALKRRGTRLLRRRFGALYARLEPSALS
jgi:hypothetical protein